MDDTGDPILEAEGRALQILAVSRDRPYLDADADNLAREAYYAGISLDGDPAVLAPALHDRLVGTHVRPLGYAPSEALYPWVDLHPDHHLYNLYSGLRVDPEEAIREDARIARQRRDRLAEVVRTRAALGADEVRAAAQEIEQELHFNCEHVVPQSWFGKRHPMRGDLHHLFACEPHCNSERGNKPYAELSDGEPIVAGCGRAIGSSAFEPFTGKGPAARATLYFLLRYPGEVGDSVLELQRDALPTLVSWHEQDPVTEYERHRNAAIFEAQGNRNPFIDVPDLAGRIDLGSDFGAPVSAPAATGGSSTP
jgi:endonuclease I